MKRFKNMVPFAVLILLCAAFFYKTLIFGKIPFPGDMLLSQYAPWRHVSYEGYDAGAVPSKNQYFDVIRELYPWKTLVINEVKNGRVPLWNPYNFSGAPLLANYQSQVFYPLTILYYLFPQIMAWTIMVVIQPLLGSVFMYLYATQIGLSIGAAILTAILFNYSSFSNVWMEFNTVWHTILWLPLLLYITERGIKRRMFTPLEHIAYIMALFSAITGGHPQDFLNLFSFLMFYTIVRVITVHGKTPGENIRFYFYTILPLQILPLLMTSVQLFPTIELFRNSARVTHEYREIIEHMLIQWWQAPLLFITDFFGNPATRTHISGDYVGKTLSIGVAGFFLSVLSLFSEKKSRFRTFFALSGTAILFLVLRSPVTEWLYRYPIPVMSTGTPTRNLFILIFSSAVLAGFGYDALLSPKLRRMKPVMIVWIILGILWVIVLVPFVIPGLTLTPEALYTIKKSLIISSVLLTAVTAVTVASKHIPWIRICIIAVCTAELWYGWIKFNPFVPKQFVFPPNPLISYLNNHAGINRIWGYGTAGIEANFATQEGIYSPDGTDPMNLKWYNQFIQSSKDGNIALLFNRTSRSDALLAPGYGETDLPNNAYRLKVMDLLGVRYVIDRLENPKNDTTFAKDRFKEIWRQNEWIIYENIKAAPRYFLTTDIRPYTDIPDFEKQLFSEDTDVKKTVLMERADWEKLPKMELRTGKAELISYTPTEMKLTVRTDNEQMLYMSDTFDSGWTALVDGEPKRVYKVNFAFRGIIVPKGTSTVQLIYRPKSFTAGVIVSLVSFIGSAWYVAYIYTQSKKKHQSDSPHRTSHN